MYVCNHACIRTLCEFVCVLYTCMYMYMYMYISVCEHVCVCVCVRACVCAYVRACMFVRVNFHLRDGQQSICVQAVVRVQGSTHLLGGVPAYARE